MNRGNLSEDVIIAQSLKISILRLCGHRQRGDYDLHADDEKFGEDALILILGRLDTEAAREAFVDLLDFELDDSLWDSIGEILMERPDAIFPVMEQRLGKPSCREARRRLPYCRAVPKQFRDRQIRNVLMDRSVRDRPR